MNELLQGPTRSSIAHSLEPNGTTGVVGELAVADTGLGRMFAHVQVPEDGNGSEVDLALAEAERLFRRNY